MYRSSVLFWCLCKQVPLTCMCTFPQHMVWRFDTSLHRAIATRQYCYGCWLVKCKESMLHPRTTSPPSASHAWAAHLPCKHCQESMEMGWLATCVLLLEAVFLLEAACFSQVYSYSPH